LTQSSYFLIKKTLVSLFVGQDGEKLSLIKLASMIEVSS